MTEEETKPYLNRFIRYDQNLKRLVMDTAYGEWVLSLHGIERVLERFGGTLVELQELMSKSPLSKRIMGNINNTNKVRKDSYIVHYLVYHKGTFYVAVVNHRFYRGGTSAVLTTWLSEDIYQRQTFAVNLSSHKEDVLNSAALYKASKMEPIVNSGPLKDRVREIYLKRLKDLEKEMPKEWRSMSYYDLSCEVPLGTMNKLHNLLNLLGKEEPFKSLSLLLSKSVSCYNSNMAKQKEQQEILNKYSDTFSFTAPLARLLDPALREALRICPFENFGNSYVKVPIMHIKSYDKVKVVFDIPIYAPRMQCMYGSVKEAMHDREIVADVIKEARRYLKYRPTLLEDKKG